MNFYSNSKVDEADFDDTKNSPGLFRDIKENFDIDWEDVEWMDLVKPLYSGLACRILIHQRAPTVPRSTESQGMLWAEEYQTVSEDHEAKKQEFVDATETLPSREFFIVTIA